MTRLGRADLDAVRFSPDQLAAAFARVEIDDHVDLDATLPSRVALDHDTGLFADCFRLGRQLVMEGVAFAELAAIAARLGEAGDLGADDRRRLKGIRAKLKLFRFDHALFAAGHRYPTFTDHLTTALGHLQDGYRTGQRARVRRKAWVVRLLLARGPAALIRREWNRIRLVDPADFRAYVAREIGWIADVVRGGTVTGAQFHAIRKVFSRQVAFYTVAGVVRDDAEHHRMFAALATINGMMGDEHDRLVARRAAGTQDYHRDRFALAPPLRERIDAVVALYRASGL